MNQQRNSTRRNRNIGTSKQGHGQNNRLIIPNYGAGSTHRHYEDVRNYQPVHRHINGRHFKFIVERTREDSCHACTVDDIAHVLQNVKPVDLDGVALIVLRQPKRKEEILEPVWGRWTPFAHIGEHEGCAIMFDAVTLSTPVRWSKSLSPELSLELERLRADGHDIVVTKRYYCIRVTLDSVRATQLYRTLLHEIGHHIDYKRDQRAFDTKSAHDVEAFAHRYADKLRAELQGCSVLPFDRIFDPQRIAADGLSESEFLLKDTSTATK